MKILNVKLQNFRAYEEVDFDLVVEDNNFVIVQALMGRGKTTFSNAIHWCLYGEESEDVEGIIVNSGALNSADDGARVPVVVTLRVQLDGDSTAQIKREQFFHKTESSGAALGQSTLSILHTKNLKVGANPIPDPASWIERVFPRRLNPYFVFNGENAAKHFQTHTRTEVRDAVLGIARVDVLKRMRDHLFAVQEEIRKDARGADPSGLAEADTALSAVKAGYAECESKVTSLREEIDQFDSKHSDLENRVKKSQALREKLTRLNTVFEAISDRDDELAKSQRDFAEWTSGTAPLNFALEAIRSLEEAIANSKAAGTYPPDFKDVALQRLLDRNQCICGRQLDDDEANTHISQLLGLVTGAGPKGDALQDLDKEVALFHERRNGLLRRFAELQAVRKSIVGEIDELEIEKSTLQSQVGDGQTIEESEVWEQLNELLNRRKDKEVQFARLEGEFEEKKRQLSTAEGEYQRLAGKSEKAKRLWVEYKFLEVAIAAIDGVYDSIVAQVRELLWTEISKNYKDWHSKKQSSDRIVLDEDFAIYKVNKSGQREPFSQGEFRLLYYSLCIALRTVSGFTFPLIIDSPWGNMDDDSRASLAHAVTGVSKDIQTAIFVLDSEYPATLAKICSVAKPRVFSIEMFDDVNSPTKRSTIKSVRN